MNVKIVIWFIFVTVCACVQIPSTLKQCNRKDEGFSECLRAAIQDVIMNVKVPIKEIGLTHFQYLDIPYMVIPAGTGPVAFEQKYKDFRIVGFSEATISKADMNFDTNTLTVHAFAPKARSDFEYEVNGRILVLPIRGKGPGFVELYDLDMILTINLEEYEKRGETHYKVKSSKFEMTPKLMKLQLENLFDGDKALGDNINQVMNDNWSEILADVQPSYEEAFGKTLVNIFNGVLARVSKKELFGDP